MNEATGWGYGKIYGFNLNIIKKQICKPNKLNHWNYVHYWQIIIAKLSKIEYFVNRKDKTPSQYTTMYAVGRNDETRRNSP